MILPQSMTAGGTGAQMDMIGKMPASPYLASVPKEGFDYIPMMVADMNFPTCPAVVESIQQRLQHPLIGFFAPLDEYFDAIIQWHAGKQYF